MHHQQAYMQRFRPCPCMHAPPASLHAEIQALSMHACTTSKPTCRDSGLAHACMHHQQAYMQRFRPCPCMHAPPASLHAEIQALSMHACTTSKPTCRDSGACMHHQQAYMQRFRPCPCMHAPPASLHAEIQALSMHACTTSKPTCRDSGLVHACMHHQQAYTCRDSGLVHACMHHQQAYMQRFRPCPCMHAPPASLHAEIQALSMHACMHHQQAYMQRFRPCPCISKQANVHYKGHYSASSVIRTSTIRILHYPNTQINEIHGFLVRTKWSYLESPLKMYLFTYPNKSLFILAQRGSDNRGCTAYIHSCESCQAQQKVVMPMHTCRFKWLGQEITLNNWEEIIGPAFLWVFQFSIIVATVEAL